MLRFMVYTLLVLLVSFFVLFFQIPDRRMHIWFLDVGQGDSILIKTPHNHQILIDGGPKNGVLKELSSVMPFYDKHIDVLVLSHPDGDHLDGLVEVLRRYEVDYVLMTGVYKHSAAYSEFLELIRAKQAEVVFGYAALDMEAGELYFDVIFPFEVLVGKEVSNVNDTSVSMMAHYKGIRILLTGDLELDAEERLVNSGVDLKADIYKAGHHGSNTSSSIEFMRRVMPEIVVIQVGLDNKFGHPREEVLKTFDKIGVKKIYRNDLEGRIEFVF